MCTVPLQGGGKQGSPHMSRKTLDGPAGMIGGAHLPSAALLHEAKLGEQSDLFLLSVLSGLWLYYVAHFWLNKSFFLGPRFFQSNHVMN